MSELWQNLLSQVSKDKEQLVTEVQPQIHIQSNVPNLLVQPIPNNQQVLGNLLVTNPIQQLDKVLPNSIQEIVIEDEDELYDENEIEDGVDIPVANSFSFEGLLNSSQPKSNPINDIFNFAPTTNVQPVKRGPGRPKKDTNTAAAVMNLMPQSVETQQDLSKSSGNNEQTFATTKQVPENLTVEISKKTILEVGESLQRIASALINFGRS